MGVNVEQFIRKRYKNEAEEQVVEDGGKTIQIIKWEEKITTNSRRMS